MVASKIPDTDASSFIQTISTVIDINVHRIQNAAGDCIPWSLKILMYVMSLLV
jgi:hypothetical protein